MYFEFITAGRKMMILFFWVLVPCRLIARCKRFGETTASIFRAEVAMLRSGGIYIPLQL
jgi:hypothetical protein